MISFCLSPSGMLFYYPVEGFLYNIAERYMEKPVEIEESDTKTDNQQKSILGNASERRASKLNQINKIKSDTTITNTTVQKSGMSIGKDLTNLTSRPSDIVINYNQTVTEYDHDSRR